jgi:NAD(P)-dependent dehydrogenase (short-subunit alcohol dehydrogenase family)
MPKTVLITGASSGFGRDTAETLASSGYRVFASMRDPSGKNREAANSLWSQAIDVVALDVTDDNSVQRAVQAAIDKAGRIDVLVNNAGIASAGVTEAFTPSQAEIVFNTNVVGTLRTARAVLPGMRRDRDGLIINIGSILGRVTFPFFGLYGASKFAVEALTESLRYEVSQFGVDVVLVQPSAYPTSMYSSALNPGDTDRAASYGSVGDLHGALFQNFMTMFQSKTAPAPHDVAAALAAIIEAPKGSRPPRTVVGEPFGANAVNELVAPIQQRALEGLGLGHLATLA